MPFIMLLQKTEELALRLFTTNTAIKIFQQLFNAPVRHIAMILNLFRLAAYF